MYFQNQFSNKSIILADGEFPKKEELLNILKYAEYIVCCDAAAEKLLDFGRRPDAIVGDLDSLSYSIRQELKGITYLFSDQDTNDLTKAFNYCRSCYINDISILGATGLREDHTLGNIFLLAEFAQQIPKVRILSDYGSFYCVLNEALFRVRSEQAVSVFAISPNTRISSEGLVWDLDDVEFKNLYCATLNKVEEGCKEIYLRTSEAFLIYLADEIQDKFV